MIPDRVLRAGFLGRVDDALADRHARGAGGPQIVEVIGHVMKFLRADDQVHVGQAVEELCAAVLRHAAQDAEDEVRVLALPALGKGGLADGLLFRRIAHAAGVQEQDIAILLRPDDAIAARAQHGGDSFAVALVHLAAIGLDEDAVQGGERV